jgi:hypothetical protein
MKVSRRVLFALGLPVALAGLTLGGSAAVTSGAITPSALPVTSDTVTFSAVGTIGGSQYAVASTDCTLTETETGRTFRCFFGGAGSLGGNTALVGNYVLSSLDGKTPFQVSVETGGGKGCSRGPGIEVDAPTSTKVPAPNPATVVVNMQIVSQPSANTQLLSGIIKVWDNTLNITCVPPTT